MQYLAGIAFGILALCGYGLGNIAMAIASKKYGTIKTAFLFFLVVVAAAVIPAIFLFSFNNFTPYLDLLILFAGVISFIGIISFIKGLEVGNVSIVASIANGWSVITVTLSIVFLDEHLNPLSVFEVLLIILGVLLVSFRHKSNKRLKLSKNSGEVKYALITMVGWGLYYFLDAIIVMKVGWFDAAFLLNLITLVLIFSYGYAKSTKLTSLGKGSYLLLFIGGLANLIASISYNLGVTFNFAVIVAPIASAGVMLPILFGIFYLKEKPEKIQILGMALIVLSIIALSV